MKINHISQGRIMRKILLMVLLTTVATQISAQETERATYKKLSIFIEGNTGTLAKNTDGLFSGNEFNFGLKYEQNFASATWLSLYTKISGITTIDFNIINNNIAGDGAVFPDNQYNGYKQANIGFDYVETGLVTDYGYIAMRDNLLTHLYTYYTLDMGRNSLKFVLGTEINPLQKGQLKNPSAPEIDGKLEGPIVELITIGLEYAVDFHPNWSYRSSLYYRTSGYGYLPDNVVGVSVIDFDSAEAFKLNSHIRFDNTISYSHENGISLFGTLRYQPSRFVSGFPEGNFRDMRTKHDIYLKFGLNYTFDFEKMMNN